MKTEWIMETEESAPTGELLLSSTFVLRREGETLRLVFYLNHRDVMAMIRARTEELAAGSGTPSS